MTTKTKYMVGGGVLLLIIIVAFFAFGDSGKDNNKTATKKDSDKPEDFIPLPSADNPKGGSVGKGDIIPGASDIVGKIARASFDGAKVYDVFGGKFVLYKTAKKNEWLGKVSGRGQGYLSGYYLLGDAYASPTASATLV